MAGWERVVGCCMGQGGGGVVEEGVHARRLPWSPVVAFCFFTSCALGKHRRCCQRADAHALHSFCQGAMCLLCRALRAAKARALLEQARLKNPKTDSLWLAAVRTEVRQRATGLNET